jgi:hypothetical protein
MKKKLSILFSIFMLFIGIGLAKYYTIGKPIEKYNLDSFILKPDINNGIKNVDFTFLGTSSFIINYKGKKLITDPFFSNPDFLKGCFSATEYPSIQAQLSKEKYENTDMIIISHGHYDHCLDIQNFLSKVKQTEIVAEQHILNEIDMVQKKYNVLFISDLNNGFIYNKDSTFRVLPIESTHSPHVGKITFFKGNYTMPLEYFPDKLYKWKLNTCYSYLIDVLDANKVHFRTLFICGELDEKSIDIIKKNCANYAPDMLLSIYWKDKICRVTLEKAFKASQPKHVMLHHWNNFFKKTEKGIEVLKTSRVEKALQEQHQNHIPSKIMLPMSSVSF